MSRRDNPFYTAGSSACVHERLQMGADRCRATVMRERAQSQPTA